MGSLVKSTQPRTRSMKSLAVVLMVQVVLPSASLLFPRVPRPLLSSSKGVTVVAPVITDMVIKMRSQRMTTRKNPSHLQALPRPRRRPLLQARPLRNRRPLPLHPPRPAPKALRRQRALIRVSLALPRHRLRLRLTPPPRNLQTPTSHRLTYLLRAPALPFTIPPMAPQSTCQRLPTPKKRLLQLIITLLRLPQSPL